MQRVIRQRERMALPPAGRLDGRNEKTARLPRAVFRTRIYPNR